MNAAKTYATQLANDLTKITMTDFFKNVHSQFYPDQDISFMEYFLELTEHEDEFYVHHSKLVEFGVMTSTESSKVKDKMRDLKFVKDEDYDVADVREVRKQGGTTSTNHYHLTPQAFKKCLMRAQRRANQPIDPVIYCDYYLLLEKVFKLYTNYERMYSEKLHSIKNDKIDSLEDTLSNLLSKVDSIVESNNRLEKHAEEQEKLAKKAEFNLDSVKTSLNAKLDTVVTMLQEKSVVSTMNPANPKLHHNFVCMGYNFVDDDGDKGRQLSFIAGQEVNVRTAMRKKFDDKNHNWTIQVGMHYNANPIDLRNNIKSKVGEYLKEVITSENAKRVAKADRQNKKLQREIVAHNKLHPEDKRFFRNEKIVVTKISRNDIPITCNKTTASYIENDYVSYDEFIEIIKSVNDETQKSPLQSETSDTDSSKNEYSDSE